jgi:hypothetical protein
LEVHRVTKKDPLEALREMLDRKMPLDQWQTAQTVIRQALHEVLTVTASRGVDGVIDSLEAPPCVYLAVMSKPGAHAVLFRSSDAAVDVCYSALARTATDALTLAYEPVVQEVLSFDQVTRDAVVGAAAAFMESEIL